MAYRLADFAPTLARGLAAAVSALYQGATFAAASQGKNRFVSNFDQHLRCLAIVFALLVAAPFFAAPVWRAVDRPGRPVERHHRRAAADHRRAEASRPTISRPRSRPAATTTYKLVEIRLQLEDHRAAAAEERPRLSAAARRDQCQDRAARAAAGRGPAGRTRHRQQRKAGAGRRKGRDQRRPWRCRKPVAARQRPDRPHCGAAPRTVRQPPDQALRHQLCAGRRGGRRLLFRRHRAPADGHCLGALRRPVQASLRPDRHILRVACGGGPADRRAAAVRPADRRRIRRSRSRPISAGCRSRSGRHCCRPPRSPSS